MKRIEAHRRLRLKRILIWGYDLFDWYFNRLLIICRTRLIRFKCSSNIKSVLIVRFSSLGDVLRATAIVDALKEQNPNFRIDLLTSSGLEDIFNDNPNVSQIFTESALPNESYDWILNLQVADPAPTFLEYDRYLEILAQLQEKSPAAVFTGLHFKDRKLIQPHVRNMYCNTEIEELYRVALLSPPPDAPLRPRLYGKKNYQRSEQVAERRRKIALFVGTPTAGAYDEGFRGYSVAYLKQLALELSDLGGVILFGSMTDRTEEERRELGEFLYGSPQISSLVNQTTLPELIDFLGSVDLVVCNDSGPLHIAIALQKDVIGMFVNTANSRLSASSHVVPLNAFAPCSKTTWRWRHNCVGCSASAYKFYGCNLKEFRYKQELLPVEDVLDAARRLLRVGV